MRRVAMILIGLAALPGLGIWLLAAAPDPATARKEAQKAFETGNFRDAYEGYRKLALDPKDDPKQVANDLWQAIDSLRRLGRIEEVDAFRKQVIEVHKDNWRLLEMAAKSFFEGEHYGFLVAGEYVRGNKRGGGRWINSYPRDRADGLKLMNQALPLALKDDEKREVGSFLVTFANNLVYNGGNTQAWRLQTLTDFNQLPDYEEGWYPGGAQGAPVDEEGNPRFDYLQLPKKWDEAKTDGERWRWLLSEAAEVSPEMHRNMARRLFANFLRENFGEQTMAQYGWFIQRDEDDTRKDESGPYAVQTLGEDETIARLASGIKRFKLPEEFNFITVYKQVAKDDKVSEGEQSLQALAEIFTNRRQYPKAAEYWKESINRFGPGSNNWKVKQREQIVNNWGQFENLHMEPAGKKATVDYLFRNGKHVDFEAHEIKVEKLLADVKAYLSAAPAQLDWNQIQIQNFGYRLVQENQSKYIGDKVASFGRDLEPREGHLDKRITIETPLEKPGAYLLTGNLKDGNVSRIIVWVADTAIVKKQLEGKAYYYVADAVTGKPVPKANVEFFGWQQKHLGGNKFTVETRNFAEFTDQNGQTIPSPKNLEANFQWMAIVRAGQRFSFLGFSHIWYGQQHDQEYNQAKVYTITDRPVYRPEQAVKFKFWVREAKYDQPDASQYAGQTFQMQITNPQGEAVKKQPFTTDKFGGFEGEFQLPKDATLGQWSLAIVDNQQVGGGGSFRVEEYKKPEYEVKVEAPAEPVMLGEKITAKVQAKYFFGAPVVDAKVKYKVLRNSHRQVWYPPMPWDWMYGRGYWWFSPDYAWYPGWRHWGCIRPAVAWRPFAHNPPEVVAEQEVAIGADGTVEIPIDTAAAKALHPDEDHEYSITAEVVDQSRRTIVGTGKVLVARKPFTVTVWVDHGYYRAGDVIQSHMSARTLDQKPVQGEGELTLYKITYNDKAEPKEEAVQTWKLATNAEGYAHQQIKAAAAGQYRLSYKLTSGGLKVDANVNLFRGAAPQLAEAKPKTIEGAYLFTIRGENFVSENYRFNDLELIPDKKEYAPGEKVKLMINVDKADSTVLLFLRPANGVYLPPKVIAIKGKSTVEELDVVTRDMPNFYVEAVTVADGHVYTETRELAVPPEKRVLQVAVKPSKEEYKPGAEAEVKIRLTDLEGKPFEGSTVLTVYDRSVEYISGGSNVADIKSFFWKWRRHHYPQTEDNLSWVFGNLLKQGETGMQYLGVFGQSVADEFAATRFNGKPGAMGPGFGGGRGSQLRSMAKGAMAPAAPMAANALGRADRQQADGFFALGDDKAAEAGEPQSAAMVEPTVRKNFADTAYWAASLTTDKNGEADVKFTLPESLTGWKMKAWAMGQGTKVGEGEAEVVTRKNLLVRMQAPRFFVETDEVVLSANVHNYLPHDKVVKVSISFEGDELQPLTAVQQSVTIKAKDEHRVDWRIKVVKEGTVAITMQALTDEESDAMQLKFPVYVHGIVKQEAFAGSIRPGKDSASVTLKVPEKRRINDARLVAQFSPSLAGAMVDALPYLVDYPHDSTDATLCRFLPTVITQNILLKMKLDLKAIRDKRTNLNAQELGTAEERAKGWKRFKRNPVFDQDEVTQMVKDGVKKLTEMQLSDGGWGWFSGWGEHSWPHTTAIVVHGLQVAKANDVAIVPGTLEKGVEWLKRYQASQVQALKNAKTKTNPWKDHADNLDALVYMVLADADVADNDMLEFQYRDRTKLSVYAMALYGLALEKQKQAEKLAMMLQNIDQYLVQDDENDTAYLKVPEGNFWWFWYGSEVEANAFYLKLLARTDAKQEKASRLAKYLINNRKHATYWNSIRDTSFAIEALAEYFVASGESEPNMTVEVWYDGKKQKDVKITADNLFTFDNQFTLSGADVTSGEHKLELRRQGNGPLYFNAYLTNFTLEDFITKAGLEIKTNRKFYKLVREEKSVKVAGSRGQAADQRVEKYRREELKVGAELKSGDLVEVELEIDSKNDYEYLMFADMKASGFEPVDVRSGYNGNDLGAYMELRDQKVTFFVHWLARGKHSVKYRLRAEIPGKFSALPAQGTAVYAPELRSNSDEMKISIVD